MNRLISDIKSKKKYTYEQQKAHVLNFQSSSLRKVEYCRLNNISSSALYRWLNEFSNLKTNNKSANFTPVKIKAPTVTSIIQDSKLDNLQVKIGNLELQIPAGYNIEYLAKLLKEVSLCLL